MYLVCRLLLEKKKTRNKTYQGNVQEPERNRKHKRSLTPLTTTKRREGQSTSIHSFAIQTLSYGDLWQQVCSLLVCWCVDSLPSPVWCSVLPSLGFLSGFLYLVLFFFFNDTATTEIYTLSLHDALPIFTVHGRTAPMSC